MVELAGARSRARRPERSNEPSRAARPGRPGARNT